MNNEDTCPFIGRKSDQNTSHLYPSKGNYCHRANPPQRIQITHQAELCLNGKYEQCPAYSQDGLERLPADIAVHKRKRKKRSLWPVIIITLGLFLVTGLFVFGFVFPLRASETGETKTPRELAYYATPTSSPLPSLTPFRTLTPIPTSTFTPFPTSTPTIAFTPFPTSGPSLTTPFGPDKNYLIHSVRAGDSFAYLENEYNTTTEVIMAMNVLGNILQPEMKLVLMPGQADPTDLPKFEVVFLDQQLDVIEIAGMYSASVEEIRYYNALGPSAESIPAGRWLIIPVEQ